MSSELTDQLRDSFAGVRVRVKWWGVTKTLSKEQRQEVADSADVDAEFIKASRKLIDTKNETYRACTKVRSRAKDHWRDNTINFPEDGVRLLPRAKLDEFNQKMISYSAELDQAVAGLSSHYSDLTYEARQKCRFNSLSDYPQDISDLFSITWELVNLEPPEYLRFSHERLYERECARINVMLQQTIANAEQALAEEFQKLLSHLVERLGYDEQGHAKQFNRPTIENLKEFFNKFQDLNVTGNDELEALVNQSKALVSGVKVDSLKTNAGVRDLVRDAMTDIGSKLDDMMVDRPRRAIRLED